jgi:hypothetical protein
MSDVSLAQEKVIPGYLIFDLLYQKKDHMGKETVTEESATAGRRKKPGLSTRCSLKTRGKRRITPHCLMI